MAKETPAERLRFLMELRRMNQSDILRLAEPICRERGIKLYKSKLSQYISGDFKPNGDMCELLGEVLDANPAWIAGYDVQMERETPIDDTGTDERLRAMNDKFPRLTPNEQRKIVALIESYLSEQ